MVVGKITNVEEADQAFVSKDNVGDVGDKTLFQEEVQDVDGSVRSATLEDAQAKAETLTEGEDVWDTDDSTLLDEEIEEVMARLSVDTTDAEGSD